jgi:hypothetical protein
MDELRLFLHTHNDIQWCGRIMKGMNEEDFKMLSDEPHKELSWVCPPSLIHQIAKCTSWEEAMLIVGFDAEWIEARKRDGTYFRLIVFPVESNRCFRPTWQQLFSVIEVAYGEEIANAIRPFHSLLFEKTYDEIDPQQRHREISQLPINHKLAHSEYITPNRFLTKSRNKEMPLTLYDVRGFFYHTIGCNLHFRGDGCGPTGEEEYMTFNIPTHKVINANFFEVVF